MNLSHPLGIAPGQVVIHRDNMNSLSSQPVQVTRKRGDQRLTFSGLHFRNAAAMQNHAANQLHVEMPHIEHAASCLAAYRERFH